MEAIELYREESKNLEEHKASCEAAGKKVVFLEIQKAKSPLRDEKMYKNFVSLTDLRSS